MKNYSIYKKLNFVIMMGIIFCSAGCQTRQEEKAPEIPQNDSTALNVTSFDSDSLEMAALIKNMLIWDDSSKMGDFLEKTDSPDDSIYTGIDWEIHQKRMQVLSDTKLFNEDFLENYQKIAEHLDRELKENPLKCYVGEIPPYGGFRLWCNCQDYPDDRENCFTIFNLKVEGDSASFKWGWGGEEWGNYVKVKKKNNSWRISYMEQFDIERFSW
ncbi:MAG: hypothetical protein PUB21_09600 [Bacteroidales bacterium]|nr:hypothetical protein [Bacteroidales bacterium]